MFSCSNLMRSDTLQARHETFGIVPSCRGQRANSARKFQIKRFRNFRHGFPQYALNETRIYPTDNNLGALSRLAEQRPGERDSWAVQQVNPSSLGQYQPDDGVLFASGMLLAILLLLTAERIFGLDQVVADTLRSWKEKREKERRDEVYGARQRFENSWSNSQDEEPPAREDRL